MSELLPNVGLRGSIAPATDARTRPSTGRGSEARTTPAFEQVLQREVAQTQGVRLSRHAQERLESRGLRLEPADLARLGEAVDRAAARGARDSLVIDGPRTYVVNVPSRTVVTAMYAEQLKGNVFTNIDSAVVL